MCDKMHNNFTKSTMQREKENKNFDTIAFEIYKLLLYVSDLCRVHTLLLNHTNSTIKLRFLKVYQC